MKYLFHYKVEIHECFIKICKDAFLEISMSFRQMRKWKLVLLHYGLYLLYLNYSLIFVLLRDRCDKRLTAFSCITSFHTIYHPASFQLFFLLLTRNDIQRKIIRYWNFRSRDQTFALLDKKYLKKKKKKTTVNDFL